MKGGKASAVEVVVDRVHDPVRAKITDSTGAYTMPSGDADTRAVHVADPACYAPSASGRVYVIASHSNMPCNGTIHGRGTIPTSVPANCYLKGVAIVWQSLVPAVKLDLEIGPWVFWWYFYDNATGKVYFDFSGTTQGPFMWSIPNGILVPASTTNIRSGLTMLAHDTSITANFTVKMIMEVRG